nr:MAG TPA: hypothetical protein [Caudoviricetes sp.]
MLQNNKKGSDTMTTFSTGDKQNMIDIANEFTRVAVNMESIRNIYSRYRI